MLLLLFVSFISGCLLTAASVAAGIFFWFYSQSVSVEEESVDGDEGTPFIQPHLPQVSMWLQIHLSMWAGSNIEFVLS